MPTQFEMCVEEVRRMLRFKATPSCDALRLGLMALTEEHHYALDHLDSDDQRLAEAKLAGYVTACKVYLGM